VLPNRESLRLQTGARVRHAGMPSPAGRYFGRTHSQLGRRTPPPDRAAYRYRSERDAAGRLIPTMSNNKPPRQQFPDQCLLPQRARQAGKSRELAPSALTRSNQDHQFSCPQVFVLATITPRSGGMLSEGFFAMKSKYWVVASTWSSKGPDGNSDIIPLRAED
jgi:hypothetical protein